TILAHPKANRLGRNIEQEADASRMQEILSTAIASRQEEFRLFSFEEQGADWLAGYTSIDVTVNPRETRSWAVLAITPLSNTLYGLEEIKQVLIVLTLGLLTANLLVTLYLARDLALPMEQLSDYALHIYHHHPAEQAPKNFKVRELNHLAEALDSMVERLEDRAEELEAAWQEAQAANQLKSEFLATTSHELRTPLNAIIGCVRLVRDDCCDSREEELEFLQQADEAAIHLLKIINDLLDIAKIEAGKVELNLQPVSIQDLCEQCLKMIQPGAEKKRLSLAIEVDDRQLRVPLDERRVRQMVINLLSNAVKFTQEGGQVKLSGRIAYGHELAQDVRPDHSPINPTTPYLCLEVIDSGIGIPKERWHLLFRPFQQIDSSLTRKHEGTGLGLALTKRLAELHGGTISFQSTPSKGSTFRIWLPSGEAKLTEDLASA
ncbi:sensor histidine kinase, partial [Leptolyngbya sp. FACHB-36]|uniref:cache domain-containing sensor histidine kinase n=1 Tax=Leptolyngbya sp. FACHB-36 TaxID=2692808 RepID=UPI001986B94B